MNLKNFKIALQLISVKYFFIDVMIFGSIFLYYAAKVYGQEQKVKDSTLTIRQFDNSEFSLGRTNYLLSPSLRLTLGEYPDLLSQPQVIPLSSISWSMNTNSSIESIWKQELIRQNEYRTLKTIVSSVQIGGVAYLAYLHIKKYGLK